MTDAFTKVPGPLMERYLTTCTHCGYERQFFGTADEARASALTMGWEFRPLNNPSLVMERAFCPHCQLLVKA